MFLTGGNLFPGLAGKLPITILRCRFFVKR